MDKEQLCKLLRKSFENFSIFLRKCNFIRTGPYIFEAKTQKQRIIRQNLLNNFYSTLNFLSSGIQYVKLFSFKFFLLFSTKSNLTLKLF